MNEIRRSSTIRRYIYGTFLLLIVGLLLTVLMSALFAECPSRPEPTFTTEVHSGSARSKVGDVTFFGPVADHDVYRAWRTALPDRISFANGASDYLAITSGDGLDGGVVCFSTPSASNVRYGGAPVSGENFLLEFCFGAP